MNSSGRRVSAAVRAACVAVCLVVLLAALTGRADAQGMATRHVRDAAQSMRLDAVFPLRDPAGTGEFFARGVRPLADFTVIPKRIFQNAEEQQLFEQLVTQHVSKIVRRGA